MSPTRMRLVAALAVLFLGAGAFLVGRGEVPPLAHAAYTLFLAALTIVFGVGTGHRVFIALTVTKDADDFEVLGYSFGIGLGCLALAVLGIGLLGLVASTWILLVLLGFGMVAAPELVRVGLRARRVADLVRDDLLSARLVYPIVALLAIMTILLALLPPWDYDGLMYHLEAPRLFLQVSRVIPLPDLVQANGPLLTQMLYLIGLGLGSDTFSKVIHLAFAWATVFLTLGAGRRLMGTLGGWLSAGVLVGIPIYFLWGVLAYADMTRAVYTFLAVWGIFRWSDSGKRGWLTGAAVSTGMALGTKLIALPLLPILGVWVLLLGRADLGRALRSTFEFMGTAALIAAPWFVLNAWQLGDPLYPMLAGSESWPPARNLLHNEYVQSFGRGRSLLDFVLLPWNLYAHHEAFAALMQSIEFPSFLFPLALLLPRVTSSPAIRSLTFPLAGLFGAWFLTSQQTRFLSSVYPLLSLMTASVLLGIVGRRRILSLTAIALVSGLVVTSLIYVGLFSWEKRSWWTVVGIDSRQGFLTRAVYDFPAISFLKDTLPPGSLVLNLWDGQGYYCGDLCLADAGQVRWPYLVQRAPTPAAMRKELATMGVTHLLVDFESLNFILRHDPRVSIAPRPGSYSTSLARGAQPRSTPIPP